MAATVLFRGTTVFFATSFFDINGNVTQPAGAVLSILPQGAASPTLISMTPPAGAQPAWTAQWDSSLAGTGTVQWSISTMGGAPRTVEDGYFVLSANAANLTSAP